MTTCTLPGAPMLFDTVGDEVTLDELIVAVWQGLGAHQTVDCPVCGAEMRPQYVMHPRPIGGSCSTCESIVR